MGSEERIKDGAGQGQTLQKAVWRARSHGENIPQRMEYIHEKDRRFTLAYRKDADDIKSES